MTHTQEALDEMKWNYIKVPDKDVLRFNFSTKQNSIIEFSIEVFQENLLIVFSAMPQDFTIDFEKRYLYLELFMRLNSSLGIGSHEMNWDTGEYLFRIGNVFMQESSIKQIVINLIHSSVYEVEIIYPMLIGIEKTPKEYAKKLQISDLIDEVFSEDKN